MNIQSLSVCVPAKRCINDCKFCCSKMHESDYEDRFSSLSTYDSYIKDFKKRMLYAKQNGCNTCILTGNNEPQQNKEFLRVFSDINNSLPNPFLNIEMQTTGSFINDDMLDFLKDSIGISTIAISVSSLKSDKINQDIIQTTDKNLSLAVLCKKIKERNINLRICLNMSDHMLGSSATSLQSQKDIIISKCKSLEADQLTFRVLWSADKTSDQGKWIKENVSEKTLSLVNYLRDDIRSHGSFLDVLEYGYNRYDYHGMSVVIDDDSMSKSTEKEAMKYLILRPNGKLYSKWDSKASLIF